LSLSINEMTRSQVMQSGMLESNIKAYFMEQKSCSRDGMTTLKQSKSSKCLSKYLKLCKIEI
jgi:hypothetical protein